MRSVHHFEYPEDREFFANLLADGNNARLEKDFSDYFDFRHPAIKRWEFNKTKKKLLAELILEHGGKCQLRIHPDCSKEKIWEPDHIVPLSTNELNKKLRGIKRTGIEKVLAQSFGSNHIKNLTLSCKRCNSFKKHRLIIPRNFYGSDLEIFPHRMDNEIFPLSSGKHALVQKYFLQFKPWEGALVPNDYNGKAIIDWNGEPVFAELAVLRLFQSHGWEGVWVDSYRNKYRVGLPDSAELVELPEKQKTLIDAVRAKMGRSGGCWDVVVWRGDELLFLELKRMQRDRLQESQIQWLDESLKMALKTKDFGIIEWGMAQSNL